MDRDKFNLRNVLGFLCFVACVEFLIFLIRWHRHS